MKLLNIILFTFLFSPLLRSQDSTAKYTLEPEKQFFKDTSFNFNGLKIVFRKNVATFNQFKGTIEIKNTTKQFIVIDPYEIFCTLTDDGKKFRYSNKSSIVISPGATEKVRVKFQGSDFRKPHLTINISKIQITEKVVATYNFDSLNISKENYRAVGAVKWTLLTKDYDIHMGVRLTGKLIYTGDKFLAITLENAKLKTRDGGNYNHINNKNWHHNSYNNTYYNKSRSHEEQILVFPANRHALKSNSNALLSYTDVLQEYSVLTLEGFKITLRKGIEADYKGQGED